jgi:hypothetical protein
LNIYKDLIMALFDNVISTYDGFPGYQGNPPTTEQEYASVNWFKDWQKPTWEEVQVKIAKLSYQRNRAAEYPPIGDQLDALWKGGAEAEAMLAKVQAVKQKYPKS